MGSRTTDAEYSQPTLSPCERQGTSGRDTKPAEKFSMFGKFRLAVPVRRDYALLVLMYPGHQRVFKRGTVYGGDVHPSAVCFKERPLDCVGVPIERDYVQIIKGDDFAQRVSEGICGSVAVAAQSDGVHGTEQCFVTARLHKWFNCGESTHNIARALTKTRQTATCRQIVQKKSASFDLMQAEEAGFRKVS